MSIISRTLVLNPVEPAPISMKLSTGLDTTVRLQYVQQDGTPYNTDFGAQFYLIARSDKRVRTYLLPSTDVVNGQAQAFIPAGDLRDPNGYNLQIIGTVNGEPRLIAKGSASVYETEALGRIPTDLIDDIDITFSYNQPASFDVTLWKDTGKTVPYDLAASTVTAAIYATQASGIVLVPFTVEVIDVNKARLTLTVEQVNSLPPQCWWSMSVSTSSGLTTLAQGDVLLVGTVQPPFTTLATTYTYNKPATLTTPASGAVQHCTNARDILRISSLDKAGTDRSSTLSRLAENDTIRVGSTVWTITSADVVGAFYQFVVTPATQDALTGDQTFTFAKV